MPEHTYKAYFEGQDAYRAGMQHYDNPYPNFSDDDEGSDAKNWNWNQWDAGWWILKINDLGPEN